MDEEGRKIFNKLGRRGFLKLLSTGVIGHTLDIDKLLWVPGEKKIFIPNGISCSKIIEIELERIIPKIRMLFERDDTFYTLLSKKVIPLVSSRDIKVPFDY